MGSEMCIRDRIQCERVMISNALQVQESEIVIVEYRLVGLAACVITENVAFDSYECNDITLNIGDSIIIIDNACISAKKKIINWIEKN